MEKCIPGTNKKFVNEEAFKGFKEMIKLTDGISLGQVSAISGIDPMVIQNWVKRGYVARPIKKKYYEKQLARILMINSLKEAMKIEDIGKLMELINGDVEDESDDLMSEEDLYNTFSKVVYHLESFDNPEVAIKKIVKKKNKKLYNALMAMVNAYIASEHKKETKKYVSKLMEEK